MLRELVKPLRILMLLVIFIAGSAGHHVALGAGPSQDHHPLSAEHRASAGHGQQSDCALGHCTSSEQSCCIMGQCMLTLAAQATPDLPMALASERWPAPGMILVAAAEDLPFRPPAA